jgi:Rrf2 family protein
MRLTRSGRRGDSSGASIGTGSRRYGPHETRAEVVCDDADVKISAKAEYAVRAALELAAAYGEDDGPMKSEAISRAQDIPTKFLESILLDLRRADLVRSQRGAIGGYRLARATNEVTIADIIRAVDGPLAYVRGARPEQVSYVGAAQHLTDVWIALRASIREVLDTATLADVLNGTLPPAARALLAQPDSWSPR